MSIEGFAIVYLCAALISLTSAGMLAGLAPGTTTRNALWIYAGGLALSGIAMLTIAMRGPWGLPENDWMLTNLCFWLGAMMLWLAVFHLFERRPPWLVLGSITAVGALLLVLFDADPRWRPLRNLLTLGGLMASMLGRAWLAHRHHRDYERVPALAMAALLVLNALVMLVALTTLQMRPNWVAPVGLSAFTAAIVSVLILLALLMLVNRRTQRQLRELADGDSLTGALTRRAFFERAERRFALAAASGDGIAMIDLDHFKQINDDYGHLAGDAVLVAAITAIRNAMPPDALLGRYGGEEFALLWPRASADGSAALDALRGLVQRAAQAAIGRPATASIGLAFRRSGEPLDATIARADAALYHAKEKGRDRLSLAE